MLDLIVWEGGLMSRFLALLNDGGVPKDVGNTGQVFIYGGVLR